MNLKVFNKITIIIRKAQNKKQKIETSRLNKCK